MKTSTLILFLCLTVSFLASPSAALQAQELEQAVRLVPYGGGELTDAQMDQFVGFSSLKNPKVLIIPQAAASKNLASSAKRFSDIFQRIGVKKIKVLDVQNPKKAKQDIEWADIIWIPGGSQVRLRKAMEKADLIAAIKKHYAQKKLIGGTSAGASIHTDVMMANSERDQKTGVLHPIISYGFGLWNTVIIDQHFSQRRRQERLELAVMNHPDLTGIGIDESTGIAYNGIDTFRVIGKGNVTLYRVRTLKGKNKGKNALEKIILKEGDSFTLSNSESR